MIGSKDHSVTRPLSWVLAACMAVMPTLTGCQEAGNVASQPAEVVSQTAEVASQTAEETKKLSVKIWSFTRESTSATSEKLRELWKEKDEYRDETVGFCDKHKDKILFAVVVGVGMVLYAISQNPSGRLNYDGIDSVSIGPGKSFNPSQRQNFLQQNLKHHQGKYRSDISGTVLSIPEQHVKGHTPPLNEAHIDHIIPRSKGGTNAASNAQVISRLENLQKGNR